MTSKTINNNSYSHENSKSIKNNKNNKNILNNSSIENTNENTNFDKKFIIIILLFSFSGFFIGRVNIFNTLNPIAIAFLGTLLFTNRIFNASLLFTIIGFYSKSDSFYISKYFICLFIMFSSNILLSKKFNNTNKSSNFKNISYNRAMICTNSIFISGLLVALFNNFSIYYFIVAILESILTFCLFYVLNIGIQVLLKIPRLNTFNTLKTLSNEQIISISILTASILYGSAYVNIPNFNNFSITYFLSFLLLLLITYIYGSNTGSVVAILSSFLLSINNIISIDFLLIFTIATAISGLFKNNSKLIFTVAFNISIIVISFIFNLEDFNNSSSLTDNSIQYINSILYIIHSLFFSSVLFLILPIKNNNIKSNNIRSNNINKASNIKIKKNNNNYSINANNFSNASSNIINEVTHSEKLQILTTDRLVQYANSFEKLSKTFSNLAEKKTTLEQQDISNLIDDVVSKVCSNCDIKVFCWEKNFYDTYQKVFNILDDVNFNNFSNFDMHNTPHYNSFINNCVKGEDFINTLNRDFDIYKLNLSWKNKVIESRELVGKQLTGVSNVMRELSTNLCQDVIFIESLENKISNHLKDNGILIKNVIVIENQKGKLEILLKVEPCYIPNTCTKTIIPLINSVVNKKMCRNCYDCIITKDVNNHSICTIHLSEEPIFRVNAYAISLAKDGSAECGDSHSFMNLSSGGYLLALSDGMGSGSSAKAESKATIELLEDFMTSGFSQGLAINMINSALFFKSSKETFATLDICNIDLYTGLCEFIKIGAVSTFIIRNNSSSSGQDFNQFNQVEVIEVASLPVGILDTIEADVTRKKLYSGDIIVMVTDGVTDSSLTTDIYTDTHKDLDLKNKDEWIIKLLEKNKSKNPEDIAQAIIEKVKLNYQIQNTNKNLRKIKTKNIIQDDTTVMVARIWE